MRRPSSILIVDDDAVVRDLLATVLRIEGYEVCHAASGEEAIEAARAERPLLVLLDIRLPRLSGYEVCRWLRDQIGGSLPIIFVSGERTEAFDRAAGLLVGADDYIVKPFAVEELLGRVRALLRRRPMDALPSRLTARELDVLRLLALGWRPGDIAERLFVSPKTVGTHIEHIYTKLGASSRVEAIAVAYRERIIKLPAHDVVAPVPSIGRAPTAPTRPAERGSKLAPTG